MKKLITAIGLMSGTSGDGIDSSIIESDGENILNIIGNSFYSYNEEIQIKIRNLKEKIQNIDDLKINKDQINTLEEQITILHSKSIEKILKEHNFSMTQVDIVGFHGQTIFHSFEKKISKQLADGKLLANLIKNKVINKFRNNDINNGGQGAPLVPVFHKLIQKKLDLFLPSVFVNIGGISNLTYIGEEKDIESFDTGPGNFLIDKLLQQKSNNKIQFDKDGVIAFKGSVNEIILENYLSDPYYKKKPPKSLDVNNFSLKLIEGQSLENSIATLSELTARTIVESISHFKKKPKLIILCGGGRKNKYISSQISKLSKIQTILIDFYKIDGDFIESQAFAYLSIRSLLKKNITFPSTTGVKKPLTGGILSKPELLSIK